MSLSVRFPFFVVCQTGTLLLSVSLPFTAARFRFRRRRSRGTHESTGRPAGERFYRRCNEGVHNDLDSGARAMLSCNRSRAYRFPDDLEALRGDWRRFTARHDSGGARVRDIAPRPRLVAPMRDLRGLAQNELCLSSGFFVRLQGLAPTALRARTNIISASLGPKD